MIQKFFRVIYNALDRVFGGGKNGKEILNGRKLTISFSSILLLFICAIFIPASHAVITNAIFIGGIVSLVTAYIGGNVLSKKVAAKNQVCKFDNQTICKADPSTCPSPNACTSRPSEP